MHRETAENPNQQPCTNSSIERDEVEGARKTVPLALREAAASEHDDVVREDVFALGVPTSVRNNNSASRQTQR